MDILKCNACGNIVEMLHGGDGQLECCNQAMEKLTPKTSDQGKEKHVPVIEQDSGTVTVKVGSVTHPMEEKHYIEWIEVIADGKAYKQFLNPGDQPQAVFNIDATSIIAREHCSVHGLWKG